MIVSLPLGASFGTTRVAEDGERTVTGTDSPETVAPSDEEEIPAPVIVTRVPTVPELGEMADTVVVALAGGIATTANAEPRSAQRANDPARRQRVRLTIDRAYRSDRPPDSSLEV